MFHECKICNSYKGTKGNLARHLTKRETRQHQNDPEKMYDIYYQLYMLYPHKYTKPKYQLKKNWQKKELTDYETKEMFSTILDKIDNMDHKFNNKKTNSVNFISQKNEIHLHCYDRVNRSMLDSNFLMEACKNIPDSAVNTFEKIYFNPDYPENHVFYKSSEDTDLVETFTRKGWMPKKSYDLIIKHYYEFEYLRIYSILITHLADKKIISQDDYERLESLLYDNEEHVDGLKTLDDLQKKIEKLMLEKNYMLEEIYHSTKNIKNDFEKAKQILIKDNCRQIPGLPREYNKKIVEKPTSPFRRPKGRTITIRNTK